MNHHNTSKTSGYIYIRTHPSYDTFDVCKMGKASNIPDRDSQYATGEIVRGDFAVVYEVPFEKMGIVERSLQDEFGDLNVRYDAGTEFYSKSIILLIEPYLINSEIGYRKISRNEVRDMVRCRRDKRVATNTTLSPAIEAASAQVNTFTRRDDQSKIINKSVLHFTNHSKGLLVVPCGAGKTLISLWIAQDMNAGTILVGVPNTLLLLQWDAVISILFRGVPRLTVSSGVDMGNIERFMVTNKQHIIITTYSSAHKVLMAADHTTCVFDMKVLDECHHLTTNNMRLAQTAKSFIKILNIPSIKQLSLTATLKQLDSTEGAGMTTDVVSNNNVGYFGEIIDRRSLLWAIQQRVVCDYVVQTIVTTEEQLEPQLEKFCVTNETDQRLFLSAYASLKSVSEGHSHHLLIYVNNKEHSVKLIHYIRLLLDDMYFDVPGLYFSDYHGEMRSKDQLRIIANFEAASIGIITCVYCLGEGWDFPMLDGVVFAENMSSNIRIVQAALRASRKDKSCPNKITKIILPILDRDDWLESTGNPDLKKVREVIYQMGMEDVTIAQKIKVLKVNIEKCRTSVQRSDKTVAEPADTFGEYDDELTRKLRLKTTKRTAIGTSYEKSKKIIANQNITSKEAYYELCERDNRLSVDPESVFRGQFINWIDYLGVPGTFYDMENCVRQVDKYLSSHPEMKAHYLDLSIVCRNLCELDTSFPPNGLWVEYYGVDDLRDIIAISTKKKKVGVVL